MAKFRMPSFTFIPQRTPQRPQTRYAGSSLYRTEQPRQVPWRLIAGGVVGLAAVAILVMGVLSLSKTGLFRVSHVQVVGAKIVDAKAIEAAAHVDNASLLNLNAEDAAKRVAALPGIAQARVHPDWPSGAVIDVSERQGWGYWQVLGTRVVIDADGRVVDKARPPADNAPTIYQVGATTPLDPGSQVDRDTVALVTRLLTDGTFMRIGLTPSRFDFEKSRGLVVRLKNGPAAVFGDSHDYEFKVAAWVAMNSRIKSERMSATEIDLRFGKELVVR